jgi:hypothetical protein
MTGSCTFREMLRSTKVAQFAEMERVRAVDNDRCEGTSTL